MFKKILDKLFPVAYVEYSITQRTKGVMVVKTYIDTTYVESNTYLKIPTPPNWVNGKSKWIDGATGEVLTNGRILNLIKCEEMYPDE